MRHDSDWLRKAFTLSFIGYTSGRETAVRHSNWLYRLFSCVKITRIDFYNGLYGIKFSGYV